MQYRDYTIQQTEDGYIVRDTTGRYLCCCPTDDEASDYIDDLLDSSDKLENTSTISNKDTLECWYVSRVAKRDIDKYSNYQYYDGEMFRYNVYNIKYFTESEAKSIAKRYMQRDDYCVYFVKHKSER